MLENLWKQRRWYFFDHFENSRWPTKRTSNENICSNSLLAFVSNLTSIVFEIGFQHTIIIVQIRQIQIQKQWSNWELYVQLLVKGNTQYRIIIFNEQSGIQEKMKTVLKQFSNVVKTIWDSKDKFFWVIMIYEKRLFFNKLSYLDMFFITIIDFRMYCQYFLS